MKYFVRLLLMTVSASVWGQAIPAGSAQPVALPANDAIVLPAGTKVLLQLSNSVSSRNARRGDNLYLVTSFPVVQDGAVVVPPGTFVQGTVEQVKRSGRVKGRAEILLHFDRLIYRNGYIVDLPGALESSDADPKQVVKDKEGTVQAPGNKGRDAATIAGTTVSGAGIGSLARGAGGAGIGAGVGLGVGILVAMLTRGDEVHFDAGTSVEMVLQRPVKLDARRAGAAENNPPATRPAGGARRVEPLVPLPPGTRLPCPPCR